jgi:hypothetical protein
MWGIKGGAWLCLPMTICGRMPEQLHLSPADLPREGTSLPHRPRRIFDQQQVAELRRQGISFRQIARRPGLTLLCFVAHCLGDLRKSAHEVGPSRLFCFNAGFSGSPNGRSLRPADSAQFLCIRPLSPLPFSRSFWYFDRRMRSAWCRLMPKPFRPYAAVPQSFIRFAGSDQAGNIPG